MCQKRYVKTVIPLMLFFVVGCSGTSSSTLPGNITSLKDRRLERFASMYEIDRDKYCLTDIDEEFTSGSVNYQTGSDSKHDAAVYLYDNNTKRTVLFVRERNGYIWVAEEESHRGKNKCTNVDGEHTEEVVITYSTHEGFGGSTTVNRGL